MFEKLNKAIINGKCFTKDTEILLYEKPENRISIIYGKNGSGKSTIGQAIDYISFPHDNINKVSLIDFEGKEIVLDEVQKSNIFVFNEDFIEQNISISGDGLSTIVMLGEQNDVEKEIVTKKEELGKLKVKYDSAKVEADKFLDKNEIVSPLNIKNKILGILKSEQGWAKRDSKIKGNVNKSRVEFDNILKKLCHLKVTESETDLRKSFDETLELYKKSGNIETEYKDKVQLVKIPNDIDITIVDLLSEEVKKLEFTDLEQEIHSMVTSGNQKFVERSHIIFADEKRNICPCCYQFVSGEYRNKLIECIEHVLNKDVKNFEERLIKNKIELLSFDSELYKTLDSKTISEIIISINECNEIISKYNEYIDKRLENVYTPIYIESLDLIARVTNLD